MADEGASWKHREGRKSPIHVHPEAAAELGAGTCAGCCGSSTGFVLQIPPPPGFARWEPLVWEESPSIMNASLVSPKSALNGFI